MKNGIRFLTISISFVCLGFFSFDSQAACRCKNKGNVEVILKDPQVQNKFFILEEEAKKAHLYQKNNQAYIDTKDLRKIHSLSNQLVSFIYHKYRINPKAYKLHTYIGEEKPNSCYQYYNSYSKEMNKSCENYSASFSSCGLCNQYLKALKRRGDDHIVKTHWFKNEEIVALVDTFQLTNGDAAYLGLELLSQARY